MYDTKLIQTFHESYSGDSRCVISGPQHAPKTILIRTFQFIVIFDFNMGLIIQNDHSENYILFDFSSLTCLKSSSIFCVFEYSSKFRIVLKGLLFLRVFF